RNHRPECGPDRHGCGDPGTYERQPVPLRRLPGHRPGREGGGAMKSFRYADAPDAQTAVAEVARSSDAKFLGGGTNLVDLMRLEVETPTILIDVSRLPYDRIEELPDGRLRIGAAVRK